MNATAAHPPVKKDPYSFSLKKIIQDVEARTGRKFTGPELDYDRRGEHHYPRATHQSVLEAGTGPSGASPTISRDDPTKRAGRAPSRSAPENMERQAPCEEDLGVPNVPNLPTSPVPPKGCDVSHVSVVLSLLPQIPQISDEAFLFLYLNISADFERRFGVQGWYDRVLTMAAQGRK